MSMLCKLVLVGGMAIAIVSTPALAQQSQQQMPMTGQSGGMMGQGQSGGMMGQGQGGG